MHLLEHNQMVYGIINCVNYLLKKRKFCIIVIFLET